MDRRVPAAFALCVAFLLVVNPLYAFPHAGQQEYYHDVEPVAASEVPEEADVLQYGNLSPEAKAALRDARNDDGVVYGEANEPPEFFYSDYASLGQGIYYVQQDGAYYRVTTYAGGGFLPLDLFARWALALLGVGIGLVGVVSARQRRRWLPVGFGAYGALVAFVAALGPGLNNPVGSSAFPIFLLAFAGVAASLATFGATGERSLVLRTVGVVVAVDVVGFLVVFLGFGGIPLFPGALLHPFSIAAFALLPVFVGAGYLGRLGYEYVSY